MLKRGYESKLAAFEELVQSETNEAIDEVIEKAIEDIEKGKKES